MYIIDEAYDMDANTYSTVKTQKKVCPLFKTECNGIFLLCHGIESKIYLSLYNTIKDSIVSTIIISDFTDEMGNDVVHSTIKNHTNIYKTEISEYIIYSFVIIDYKSYDFSIERQKKIKRINKSQEDIISECENYLR